MGRLTRVPLGMLEPGSNAMANDNVVYNGEDIELQSKRQEGEQDNDFNRGAFDPETGTLHLHREDGSVLQISGFMTVHNIGVGRKGATGPRGAAGVSGRNGRDGRPGIPGCMGPKGDWGPMGPAGPQGATGPQGVPGPTGPTGPSGATGPGGIDGASPEMSSAENVASETVGTGRIMQWGRFTDSEPELKKTLLFSEALQDASKPLALHIQFVDPSVNIANKVKVTKIAEGYADLEVVETLLDMEPNGAGGMQYVSPFGWDFYWFLIGQ